MGWRRRLARLALLLALAPAALGVGWSLAAAARALLKVRFSTSQFLKDGKEKSVFDGANGMVRRGEKIAVVGVNGAGKSSFLKIVAQKTPPTKGKITLGANVHMGYFSQHSMDILSPEKSVFDIV